MKSTTKKQNANAVKISTNFSCLDEMSEDRRHNLFATPEQLERERAERIKAFEENAPETAEMVESIISDMMIQEHIMISGYPKDEYRNYKVLAVQSGDIFTGEPWSGYYRLRILLEDCDTGARHLITTTCIIPKISSAKYDPTFSCKNNILSDLAFGEDHTKEGSIVGKTLTLRTIDGAPVLPKPSKVQMKEAADTATPYKPDEWGKD